MTLDLSNFRTVFDDDFANDTSFNSNLWISYGNTDQSSLVPGVGETLTGYSYQAGSWNPVGFLQLDNSKSAGEGYGLYSFTGYANAGQGQGICFLMWRADGTYLDATTPDVATEIDALETSSYSNPKLTNGSTSEGYSNVHYYDSGSASDDGQVNHQFTADVSVSHTYAIDWERGSITLYVDGQEIYQDTTHAPLDYADGGSNEVMGAEVTGEVGATPPKVPVQLHITDMSYSAPVADALPVPPAPSSASETSVTLSGGAQAYAPAAGVSVQPGGGSDTITALAGDVFVAGAYGTLLFYGGSAASEVAAGEGSVTVFGGAGGGNYSGGSGGNNVLVSQGASGANTTLTGGAAGDQIFGSAAGNDVLVAARGRESILGGSGNSTIIGGGTAASVIFTGGGSTLMYGGDAGGDTVVGGSGGLNVIAQNGDAVFGNSGQLDVSGSTKGADSIIGGSGALVVAGRGGNMLVVAGTSTSQISVGTGASLIFTATGSSTVTGGTGSMELILGSGASTVYEGGGPTTYEVVKGAAGGIDIIHSYNAKTDHIDLYGYKSTDMKSTTTGGTTTLSFTDGTKIELLGVTSTGKSII